MDTSGHPWDYFFDWLWISFSFTFAIYYTVKVIFWTFRWANDFIVGR